MDNSGTMSSTEMRMAVEEAGKKQTHLPQQKHYDTILMRMRPLTSAGVCVCVCVFQGSV